MTISRRSLVKPLAAAIILVISISMLAIYIIPKYVYVSPFSSFYASGIVDHKKIGYGTDNGAPFTTYTVSVTLFNEDPVNRIQSGDTLAYTVSKADWDTVAWGDTVKIKILPNAKAEIVELYPTLSPPVWQQQQLSVSVELTSDKPRYTLGENANFTVHLVNSPLPPGDSPYNVTVSVFRNCLFYAFQGGKTIFSNENSLGTISVILQPSQEVDYNFNWDLTNIPSGVYYVRAYIGYLTGNEEVTLSATTMIYVFE